MTTAGNNQGDDFIAIDFETATGNRASICEAGICVVSGGKIAETRSWLVRPQGNRYSYFNIQIHGIHPYDTENAPEFPAVWTQIGEYLKNSSRYHTAATTAQETTPRCAQGCSCAR